MISKLNALLVSASALTVVACGGKTSSSDEATRRDAEKVLGQQSPTKGQQGQQGNQQGGGQQGPIDDKPSLVDCEFRSEAGLVNCGSLDTILVPEQETLSRFEVRYEFNCGEQGLVSPIGVESGVRGTSDYQRRAFIFGSVSKISLYGKGPLKLESRNLDKAIAGGLSLKGCRLLVEVESVEPRTAEDMAKDLEGSVDQGEPKLD